MITSSGDPNPSLDKAGSSHDPTPSQQQSCIVMGKETRLLYEDGHSRSGGRGHGARVRSPTPHVLSWPDPFARRQHQLWASCSQSEFGLRCCLQVRIIFIKGGFGFFILLCLRAVEEGDPLETSHSLKNYGETFHFLTVWGEGCFQQASFR